jgi:hypothetical protein
MIEELIKRVAGKLIKVINFEAEVISVDQVKDICVVKPVDGSEIDGVKLKSILSDAASKFVIYPKVGSFVTVSILQNMETECYVSQYSEIEKIVLNTDVIVINNGDNGGLVNWPSVKAELDKTNQVVNALVQSLTGFTPVPNDGGNALKIYATSQLSGKQVGDYNDKEDTKFKH